MNEQQQQNNPSESNSAPRAELTEAEYLAKQAGEAAAAIGAAFAAMKADIGKGVDPRAVTKQHPWIAMGTAAVAGFVAANALVPSKEEQALKKLERIERSLQPRYSDYGPQERPAVPQESKSVMSRVFGELLSTLRPVLASALTAYAAQPQPPRGDGHGNGHTGASTAGASSSQQSDAERI
jgi:hypothetical protein